jgi:hypothetical protein
VATENVTPRAVGGKLVLDVVARHLVLQGGGAAAEDADLGRRPVAGDPQNAICRNAAVAEDPDQCGAGFIVAHRANRGHVDVQGAQVGESVGAAAGDVLLTLVTQDDHRRLAGDPLGRAEDEPVEDEIADQRHPGVAEGVNEIEQAFATDHDGGRI